MKNKTTPPPTKEIIEVLEALVYCRSADQVIHPSVKEANWVWAKELLERLKESL